MTQIPVVQVPMRLLDTPPMLAVDEPVAPALFQQTWQSLSDADVITKKSPEVQPEPQPADDNQDESEAPIPVMLPVIENPKKQSLLKPDTNNPAPAQTVETNVAQARLAPPVGASQAEVAVETTQASQDDPPTLPTPLLTGALPGKSFQIAEAPVPTALPKQVVTVPPSAPDTPALLPVVPTDVEHGASPAPPSPPIAVSPAVSSIPSPPVPSMVAVVAPAAFRLMPSDDQHDSLMAVPPVTSERAPSPHIAPGQPQAAHRAPPVHVAQQLAVALAASDTGTTEVTLNPEELGRVRLSLTPSDTGITVSIMAERPETADLMRRHLDTLTREFQAIGYDDVTFDFTGDGGADPDQQPQEGAVTAQPADIAQTPPGPAGIAMLSLAGLDLKL